jgi:hypothetical protein
MAINFPNGATNGQQYTAENGSIYRFDGEKWVIDGAKDTLYSVNNFTASYYEDSASFDSILTQLVSVTSSFLTSESDSQTLSITNNQLSISNGNTITIPTGSELPSGVISGSSQLTSSYDSRYVISGSITQTTWDNIASKPSGIVSGSSQILGGSGIYSSSAQLPSGLISGSSQLTASYDTRYTLSGSVVSGTTPAGTISGSAQISAFGFVSGSYVTTSSFNSFTASAQTVTTGSNSFNGIQTITGSLIVTTGSFVGSQILANTSSLYLTSGSNMYVQNNGLVEITGSLNVSGSNNINLIVPVLQVGTGSGDEGGELLLAKAVTNTTLTGSGVTVDVYRDRLRLFEQGGGARGVYIDLAKTPGGVAGELIWKASGMVNAGTFVTLDNIKAQVPTSGNRGLSVATVSGTVTGYISGHYQGIMSSSAGTSSTTSLSTTATSSMFGWNFGQQGDMSTYILRDDTNSRVYRIILIIGGSYLNNFISIERLY